MSQGQPLSPTAQVSQKIEASLPEITKDLLNVTGYEDGAVLMTGGAYQLVVTVLNTKLATSLEREAEAAKIAATISRAIAAKPEFGSVEAYHIDYVTRTADRRDVHLVDGIDFRKDPKGNFVHHKS